MCYTNTGGQLFRWVTCNAEDTLLVISMGRLSSKFHSQLRLVHTRYPNEAQQGLGLDSAESFSGRNCSFKPAVGICSSEVSCSTALYIAYEPCVEICNCVRWSFRQMSVLSQLQQLYGCFVTYTCCPVRLDIRHAPGILLLLLAG